MSYETENDLGYFEGFNFRTQAAIPKILNAEDVINWDHDADGEAEFWPEGSNVFVRLLCERECTGGELIEIDRIFSELKGDEAELCKAVYLKQNNGLELKDITREATDDSCLYIFGPGFFSDLKKEAAWELFEQFHPETYKLVETWTIPGLDFDEEQFLNSFSTQELKTGDYQGYLVVDTQ